MKMTERRIHNKVQLKGLVMYHVMIILICLAAVFIGCTLTTVRKKVAHRDYFELIRLSLQKLGMNVPTTAALSDYANTQYSHCGFPSGLEDLPP